MRLIKSKQLKKNNKRTNDGQGRYDELGDGEEGDDSGGGGKGEVMHRKSLNNQDQTYDNTYTWQSSYYYYKFIL